MTYVFSFDDNTLARRVKGQLEAGSDDVWGPTAGIWHAFDIGLFEGSRISIEEAQAIAGPNADLYAAAQ